MKHTVVITDWGFPSLDAEHAILEPHDVAIRAHQCKTEQEVAAAVAEADVVMAQWAPVKRTAIAAMKRCRGIVRYGIGLDNVDLDAAAERSIPVRNVPDYCLDEVADHTMALLLAVQRQVRAVDSLVRGGTWKITPPLPLPPLRASVLGLVGFGRIARLVATRAQSFGVRVVAFDPLVPKEVFARAGVEQSTLEDLFRTCDLISLHCPLTETTRHLVNDTTIATMKEHAIIVNTSRGGLVHTDALVTALNGRRIAGAGLDVFEQEPLPDTHPLRACDNVILTSHNAWYSSASVGELQKRAALAALGLLQEHA